MARNIIMALQVLRGKRLLFDQLVLLLLTDEEELLWLAVFKLSTVHRGKVIVHSAVFEVGSPHLLASTLQIKFLSRTAAILEMLPGRCHWGQGAAHYQYR